MTKRYEVFPGALIGRLVLVELAVYGNSAARKWRCRCSCGTETLVLERNLINGHSLSCGCLQRSRAGNRTLTQSAGRALSCQKRDCRYHSYGGCVYFMATGHTRLALHKDEGVDINNPCREYDPGEKALLKMRPFTLNKDYEQEVPE